MPNYIEKVEQLTLPVVILRGSVAFPSIALSFEVTDSASAAAAQAAADTNSFVLLVAEKQAPEGESFHIDQLYKVGTVAKIKQSVKTPEGNTRLIVEGYSRATVTTYHDFANYLVADAICKTVTMTDNGGMRGEAFIREANVALEKMVKYMPSLSSDILVAARAMKNPGLLADFIAAHILVQLDDKQTILEIFEPMARIDTLILLLEKETDLLDCEYNIHKQVRARLNRNQREYYLREQIRTIQDELGEGGDGEIDEYERRIREARLPKEIEEKLLKENDRMAKTPFGSAEATVLRNYLDTCLELPWNKKTKDRVDVAAAKKILDADHDGLEKVKERILEFLAVRQLNPEIKNQIICLVGPPGTGKTSVASSIARSMKRKYVRVSLGGIRDEADIRGHRKTYIGAMPGRITNALIQAKVNNPLILLDEIDKMTSNAQGDPASALLEVLDSEQNKTFRDHFVELPFDLSDCLFIATANTLSTIPRPLLDRMEVIELKIYTRNEKLSIARNHLVTKQMKRHGLNRRMLKLTDDAIFEMIDFYTREAGVRNLERTIADVCRKVARKIVEGEFKSTQIDASNIASYLGPRKLLPEHIKEKDEIGVVNGLAYTELGGSMLKVEVAVLEGTGKIETTGSLGDVMKESARIAVSYIRSIAKQLDIPTDFYKTKDIHIHFPEGAVPKDGPSAGVTMMTALVSALTDCPVRHDIAMTGEISLRGNVLAIGGLKEKTMAAYMAGCRRVLIPADNVKDLEEIDPIVRENLVFTACETASDVLSVALLKKQGTSVTGSNLENPIDLELLSSVPAVGSGTVTTGIAGHAQTRKEFH